MKMAPLEPFHTESLRAKEANSHPSPQSHGLHHPSHGHCVCRLPHVDLVFPRRFQDGIVGRSHPFAKSRFTSDCSHCRRSSPARPRERRRDPGPITFAASRIAYQPPLAMASSLPADPPKIRGLPVAEPNTLWRESWEYSSIIQAITLIIGSHIRGGDVSMRPMKIEDAANVCPAEALQLSFRHLLRVADHASFGPAEGKAMRAGCTSRS